MNDPRQHPVSESLRKMEIDQTTEADKGIEIDPDHSVSDRQTDRYQRDLAEEGGQKDASWTESPASESENQGENNDIYGGMSQ